jgi:hypothetical protein
MDKEMDVEDKDEQEEQQEAEEMMVAKQDNVKVNVEMWNEYLWEALAIPQSGEPGTKLPWM